MNSETAPSFEADWSFVREAIPVLQNYILSNDLYWPMPGVGFSAHQTQLTIGTLLLSLARLRGVTRTGENAQALAELAQQVDKIRKEWLTHWSNKAAREFASRLKQWQHSLNEMRDSRSGYTSAVRQRAILELLSAEAGNAIAEYEIIHLTSLDQLLRSLTVPAEFIWEAHLADTFPPDAFWFLFMQLRPHAHEQQKG